MNEFSMIGKYFQPLTMGHREALDLTDDAAVFKIPRGRELVVTTDTLGAGTHFIKGEAPAFIAHKCLRVNLSDLAAMSAAPLSYQLAIAFPSKPSEKWLKEFCGALLKDQKEFGIYCSGGDTTVTKGPLTISITALGLVPKNGAIKRSGARPGDALIITGPVGDALAGLRMLQNKIKTNVSSAVAAYRKPVPRLTAAPAMRKYARAAIDISDGLVADIGHICETSNCAAEIDIARIGFSQAVKKYLSPEDAITGGDDYELALAVRPAAAEICMKALEKAGMRPRLIGRFVKGAPAVQVFDRKHPLRLKKTGWKHF